MNTTDAKRVLETALICAQQPLPLREMGVLFNGAMTADTLKLVLEDLQNEWAERGVELVHATLEQLAMTDERAQVVPEATRAFYARRFLATTAAGLRGMADAMTSEPDRVAELAACGIPVLVAHGVADDAWTPAAQTQMARRLGARHEVISGAIHSPAVENPPRTLEVLTTFWSSLADDAR